jgi:polysaccharide biosynthesis transport protein
MKSNIAGGWHGQGGGWPRGDSLEAPAAQANRRRRRVFLGTLIIALAISLGFTWLRQPEYRASVRLEITPATVYAISGAVAAGAGESARPFLTEVQVLASRPVLEAVATRLRHSGLDLATFGADPIAGMQSQLEAVPVPGTNVVELVATGNRSSQLAPLLNAIADVYQERLAQAYQDSSSELLARADEEVDKLERVVTAKRRDVEAFRTSNDIVSLQRDENEILARVRNLSTSLSAANDRVAAADGRLRALTESAAAGQGVVRARDDPTLANLEQRASQLREELRDLERGYTSEYLAKDPRVITQRTRLAELERQIAVQRAAGQQSALFEAKQELASAQLAAARIQNQMASGRQEVAQFTARFNEYKSRQDELSELETAYRDAVQRRAKLEASERARMPSTKVLEAATTPQEPWRPLYWRDTALSVVGSLVLALLAMWLVDLLNRPEPQPAVVLIQPQVGELRYEAAAQARVGRNPAHISLAATEPALLPRQVAFPRELDHDEVTALIRASDDECRLLILLLLSGVTLEEALELRWSDVDPALGTIRVGGESGRDIVLRGALRRFLEAAPKVPGSELFMLPSSRPATRDSIDAQILVAAHDAALDNAPQVTAECLRHTYLAFLVRQGIRFADLTRLVGPLPVEAVSSYSALAPQGARLRRAQVQVLHPALEEAIV